MKPYILQTPGTVTGRCYAAARSSRFLTSEASVRILVVDRDPLSLGAILCSLRRSGHVVRGTRLGADVLSASEDDYDLLLIDRQLEDMSGIQLLAELSPERRTTCILITRFGHTTELATARRLGVR